MRPLYLRKSLAWLLVVGALGGVAAYQAYGWQSRSREVARAEAAVQEARDRLARAQAEQEAARQELRKPLDAALAAERELAAQFAKAHADARKAAEEKDFVVRLTGPAHVQPGAPNKWLIETLRHGAVGRPKKLDVVVKDSKDNVLHRQTDDKPVGRRTSNSGAAFWAKVKPGTELFVEVLAHTDDPKARWPSGCRWPARCTSPTSSPTSRCTSRAKPSASARSPSTASPEAADSRPAPGVQAARPGRHGGPLDTGNGRLLRDLQPVNGPDGKPLRGIGVGEYTLGSDAVGGEYKLDLYEVGDAKKERYWRRASSS
jgi:hypothetical protein